MRSGIRCSFGIALYFDRDKVDDVRQVKDIAVAAMAGPNTIVTPNSVDLWVVREAQRQSSILDASCTRFIYGSCSMETHARNMQSNLKKFPDCGIEMVDVRNRTKAMVIRIISKMREMWKRHAVILHKAYVADGVSL